MLDLFLYIHGCNLVRHSLWFPVGFLSRLEKLSITGNSLVCLPETIGNLRNVSILDLHNSIWENTIKFLQMLHTICESVLMWYQISAGDNHTLYIWLWWINMFHLVSHSFLKILCFKKHVSMIMRIVACSASIMALMLCLCSFHDIQVQVRTICSRTSVVCRLSMSFLCHWSVMQMITAGVAKCLK